jgi:hypothetical protein
MMPPIVSIVERERAEIYALRVAVLALLRQNPSVVAELNRIAAVGMVKPADLAMALPMRDQLVRDYLKVLVAEAAA